jgi:hypothetical protein
MGLIRYLRDIYRRVRAYNKELIVKLSKRLELLLQIVNLYILPIVREGMTEFILMYSLKC